MICLHFIFLLIICMKTPTYKSVDINILVINPKRKIVIENNRKF